MPNIKSSSGLSAAHAADAAIAAYLRALADRRAAELNPPAPRDVVVGRWSAAPLIRGHYQVVPLWKPQLERLAFSSRAEPHAAQRRGVR